MDSNVKDSRVQTGEAAVPLDAGAVASIPASDQLRLLEEQLRFRLLTGSERLRHSDVESADVLRREAGYMAENLEGAIRHRLGSDAPAVKKACDYLGSPLHELRWTLDLKSDRAQQSLAALLDSLEPQVSECWRNALRFLEAGDLGMAKQHFASLVTAVPIRHLAHQYLGFLAARMGDRKEAVKQFELARRHAETDHDRAVASSHLAGSWFAAGDRMRAAKAALSAAECCPDEAKYWYETAAYCAGLGKNEHLEEFLGNAIRRDWLYWPMAIVDPNFDCARAEVAKLLGDMREQQRLAVRAQLQKLREIVSILRETEAGVEVLSAIEIADELDREFNNGSIFTYLRLASEIPEAQKQFLRRAMVGFDKRLRMLEAGMSPSGPDNANLIEAKIARIKAMQEEAAGKDKISTGLVVARTVVQLWTAVGIPASAWAFYDYLNTAGAEHAYSAKRLTWLVLAIAGPWAVLIALLMLLHRLPAKLIRQRARDLERELEKSADFRNRKSEQEQAKVADDLDRLLKQRETVEEYLRALEQ